MAERLACLARAKKSCRNSETVLTIVNVRGRDCCSPQSPPCSDFIASRLFSIHSRQKPRTKTKPKLSAQGKKNGNTITSPMFPDCACRNSSHAQSAPFLRHFPDTSVIKLKCSAFYFYVRIRRVLFACSIAHSVEGEGGGANIFCFVSGTSHWNSCEQIFDKRSRLDTEYGFRSSSYAEHTCI